MKLFVCGYARSGKDHAGEYLRKAMGLEFESSSYFAAKKFIFEYMNNNGYNYKTLEDCFKDRRNNRKLWYDLITDYNKVDLTSLSEAIFKENDAYIGLRNYKELAAAKLRWDDCVVIWIDASGRIEAESTESCTVYKDQADFVVENKSGIVEFDKKLSKLAMFMKPTKDLEYVAKRTANILWNTPLD